MKSSMIFLYFLIAMFPGIFLVENTTEVKLPQGLFYEIIQDAIIIVYGNGILEKTTCSEVKSSKLYYYLYTPKNQKNATFLNLKGRGNALTYFDPSLETKLITHGWAAKVNGSWPEEFKNAYLKTGNYNIILLDWSKYSTNTYSKASCYLTKVANVTAQLIVQLHKNAALDLNKTHLIGHSLGGQLVGITGQFIQNYTSGEKVKRVSALDAAGPLFCYPERDDNRRVTADDAHFVDGIHTNEGEFGCAKEYAQSNFYPNCGRTQPGCFKVDVSLLNITGSFDEIFSQISCNHARARQYWLESILKNDFPSESCDSCLLFETDFCSKNFKNNMGEYTSDSKKGKYFLRTHSKPPYGEPLKEKNVLTL